MHSEIYIENISTEDTGERLLFILQCQVINGTVQTGSNMSLPFSTGIDMTIPVDEVEVVGDQHIRIKVHCEDLEEIEFLLGLNLNGENLLIE
jgi:hypothetical protein